MSDMPSSSFRTVVRGTKPLLLVEGLLRTRIMGYPYWREQCLGMSVVRLVDLASTLQYAGGTYGATRKPTPFICLVTKMLQLELDVRVGRALVEQPDFKYARLLGALYVRLMGSPLDVYRVLEPLLYDCRPVRVRSASGFARLSVDAFVDALLREPYSCDIVLPRLPPRYQLESAGLLPPRPALVVLSEAELVREQVEIVSSLLDEYPLAAEQLLHPEEEDADVDGRGGSEDGEEGNT